MKDFIHDDPKSFSILSIDFELIICSAEPKPCALLGDADVVSHDPPNPSATTPRLQRVKETRFLFEMMGFKHLNTSEDLIPNAFSINIIKFGTHGAQMPNYFVITLIRER